MGGSCDPHIHTRVCKQHGHCFPTCITMTSQLLERSGITLCVLITRPGIPLKNSICLRNYVLGKLIDQFLDTHFQIPLASSITFKLVGRCPIDFRWVQSPGAFLPTLQRLRRPKSSETNSLRCLFQHCLGLGGAMPEQVRSSHDTNIHARVRE